MVIRWSIFGVYQFASRYNMLNEKGLERLHLQVVIGGRVILQRAKIVVLNEILDFFSRNLEVFRQLLL